MEQFRIRKYPRTPHIEGSRVQPGDEDLRQVPFEAVKGRHLVIEEKCDGANSAVSFDADGALPHCFLEFDILDRETGWTAWRWRG